MTRSEQRERTRAALLTAAATEFEARGYAATTLADVAAHLGLVRATVHFHFHSKQALAEALVDRFTAFWEETAVSAAGRPGGSLRTLQWLSHELAEGLVGDVVPRAGLRILLAGEIDGHALPDPHQGWVDLVHGHLERAREAGEIRPDVDLKREAWSVVAMLTGAIHLSLSQDGGQGIRARIDQIWDHALALLAPGASASRDAG